MDWIAEIDWPAVFGHLVSSQYGVVVLIMLVLGVVVLMLFKDTDNDVIKLIAVVLLLIGVFGTLLITGSEVKQQLQMAELDDAGGAPSTSRAKNFTMTIRTRNNDHADSAGTNGNLEVTLYSEGGNDTVIVSGAGKALNQGSVVRDVVVMPSSDPISHISIKLIDNGTDQVGWLGEYLSLTDTNGAIAYCWTWRDKKADYLAPSRGQGMTTGLLPPKSSTEGCNP